MPSSLNGTGVTFNDGTTLQSGNIPAANLGSGTANSSTFLRGDRTFATVPPSPPEIEILNTQTFTSSGTWTKPAVSANDTLILAVIGGGGSGSTRNASTVQQAAAGGGGGGGVVLANFRIGDLAATIGVTVGSGGAARSGGLGSNGLSGGASLFGNLVKADGGGGGTSVLSQVGAGGASGRGNLTGNQTAGGLNLFASFGREGRSDTITTPIGAGLTGGGGAGGHASNGTQRTQNRPAGTSRLFGNGGAGAFGTATSGSAPGGGGGGATTRESGVTSGAGARGEVRCFVVRGRFSASAFFGID